MGKGLESRPEGPRISRALLLTTGGGFATAALIQGCGGPATTQAPPTAVAGASSTASTTFPLSATSGTYPLPPVGAFRGSMTVPGLGAPTGAVLTIVDSLNAPAGAPTLQSRARIPQSGTLSVLFFIQISASDTVTLPSLPRITITVPSSQITPGARFFYAISDPTVTNVALQFRTEGPAGVTGTTLTFAASSNPITFTAGLKYIIAVYSESTASSTIESQLAAIFLGPDGSTLRSLASDFLTDPALVPAVMTFRQNHAMDFSGFQLSLLDSIGISTGNPSLFRAILALKHFTEAERNALAAQSRLLENNPAIQLLLSTANTLKSQPSTLANDASVRAASTLDILRAFSGPSPSVSASAPPTLIPFASPTPWSSPSAAPSITGDPATDAVFARLLRIASSSAFINTSNALVPILQSPDFVTYLQTQPPAVVASIISASDSFALQLPSSGTSVEGGRRRLETKSPRDKEGLFAAAYGAVATAAGYILEKGAQFAGEIVEGSAAELVEAAAVGIQIGGLVVGAAGAILLATEGTAESIQRRPV